MAQPTKIIVEIDATADKCPAGCRFIKEHMGLCAVFVKDLEPTGEPLAPYHRLKDCIEAEVKQCKGETVRTITRGYVDVQLFKRTRVMKPT